MGRKTSLLLLVALTVGLTAAGFFILGVEPWFAAAQLLLLGLMALSLWRWPRASTANAKDQIAVLKRDASANLATQAKLIGERAAVVREFHHRVKNNLQIVFSLLDLQVGRLTSREARDALAATRTRISVLALLHRHLHDDHDFHSVEMRPFIEDLCAHINLLEDEHRPVSVAIMVSVDPGRLLSDQAAGLGQIITEAALNARQHAFFDKGVGIIRVSLQMSHADAVLTISDDGSGSSSKLPGEPRIPGVGSALIYSFAKQIGGSADIAHGAGAIVTVHFKPQFASN